jgi:ubiquinone/menaquinone biosynthesis C-methylase UbiE
VSTDAHAADQAARETWARAASAWERRQDQLREATAAVSQGMVDAIDPQPGQRVLELAAGPGETGFIAAQRLGPEGRLISTDQSSEMVAVAQRRARALGLENVDFAVLDAQHIDLEPDSFDAVLCRFGYMLMADPAAALRGTRRVLKPGGRLALAVWDNPQRNLWMAVPVMTLVARGVMEPPAEHAPTPFSMADRDALAERLTEAGFSEILIVEVTFTQTYASFDQYWEITRDLAAPIAQALTTLDEAGSAAVRGAVQEALGQFAIDGGELSIPAVAVLATATA